MSEPFIGQITLFAGNFAPRGWAFCNGQLLSIAQNTALFSILGTTYGGDGQTTFALPNLQSRVPIHPGQGPGLSPYVLGQVGGQENHTLIVSEIPAHAHSAAQPASSSDANTGKAGGNIPATGPSNYIAPASADTTLGAFNTGIAGGSQPHNNIQPYQCINYIIALEGIFPSRN